MIAKENNVKGIEKYGKFVFCLIFLSFLGAGCEEYKIESLSIVETYKITFDTNHTRNTILKKVVWKQDDVIHDRFYW